MQHSADRLGDFAAALLDPERVAPAGLVGPDGEPSAKRFAVYRNNVVVGLTEALKDAFPAVCRIVGDEFFRAMARLHVLSEPPASPILLDYGAQFPDFIARFEPAATLPYLADVARIERAWTEAYHAREAAPLKASDFAAIDPDRLAEIHLALHPSLRVVRSRLPVLTIWRMNVGDGVPGPVDLDSGGEDALIVRPDAEVEVLAMPPGGAEFVAALARQLSVTEATRAALIVDSRFDLSGNLAGLIATGVFVGYDFGEGADSQARAARS